MRLAPGLRSYDRRKLEARLDALWGRIIQSRANYRCEVCGSQRSLNAAHIMSRSRKSTRWSVENGVCCCVGHHLAFHRNPLNFYEWVEAHRGVGTVDKLRILSQGGKPDLEMIKVQLTAAAREYAVRP